jgi:hypothetical protein
MRRAVLSCKSGSIGLYIDQKDNYLAGKLYRKSPAAQNLCSPEIAVVARKKWVLGGLCPPNTLISFPLFRQFPMNKNL